MLSHEAARSRFERQYWTDLLRYTGGNVSAAARFAGRNRTHVHKMLVTYGIEYQARSRRGNWGDLTH